MRPNITDVQNSSATLKPARRRIDSVDAKSGLASAGISECGPKGPKRFDTDDELKSTLVIVEPLNPSPSRNIMI
jgi:hypothetical protein